MSSEESEMFNVYYVNVEYNMSSCLHTVMESVSHLTRAL